MSRIEKLKLQRATIESIIRLRSLGMIGFEFRHMFLSTRLAIIKAKITKLGAQQPPGGEIDDR